MCFKKLREPPTVKTLLQALGLVALVVVLFFAGRVGLHWYKTTPQPPWRIKQSIRTFLKKHSGHSTFQVNYDFNLEQTLANMRANLSQLRTNIVLLHTNIGTLQQDVRKLTQEVRAAQDQERTLRVSVNGLNSDLVERQRRHTNRLADLSLSQSNVLRAETNYTLIQAEAASLESASQTLSNQLASLRGKAAMLQTNISLQQTSLTVLLADLKLCSRESTSNRTQLAKLKTDLAAQEARFAKQTNDSTLAESMAALQTNAAALQLRIAAGETNAVAGTNQVAALQQKMANLQKDLAALQKEVTDKQQELTANRRALTAKQTEMATRLRGLGTVRTTLSNSQNAATTLQTNLAAASTELEARRGALAARQKEITAKQTALAAAQKELAAKQADVLAKQKEAIELQKSLTAKDLEMGNQQTILARDIRKQVTEAGSYEQIYKSIGQELWVVDKLLGSSDVTRQRQSLPLALEASQHAMAGAENPWLACRICEAYVWPNLDLADPPDKPRVNAEQLLAACGVIFTRAEDFSSLIRNYQLTLNYVTNDVRADAARFSMAYTHEQLGQFDDAIKWYRQVKTTNYLRQADQRMLIAQDLRRAALAKAQKKPKKWW